MYTGALEHADNGIMDLFSAGNHLSQDQPSHDGTVGSRQSDAAVLEESFTDHRAKHTGNIGDLWLQDTIHLKEIKTTVEFVTLLRDASLNNPFLGMSPEALEQLQNLLHDQPLLSIDEDTWPVIDLYLGNC